MTAGSSRYTFVTLGLAVALSVSSCGDLATGPQTPGTATATAAHPAYACDTMVGGVYVMCPVSPYPTECDKYTDLSWCQERDEPCTASTPRDPRPDDFATVSGCPGPGSGPGAGGAPPSPPPANDRPIALADTCHTGDPVVDDPQVSEGLRDLWMRSNPDANLAQRRETAGWIVEHPAGQFIIVPIATMSSNFGCADFMVQVPAHGTIVGFVHTHPYQLDETIVDCEFTNVGDYTGAPSNADRTASEMLGNLLGRSDPLPGYIIDKDGYFRFQGTRYTATPRLPRCGY